ncbi:unnamed protein product [Cuscuta epithymum]|uniref:RNase H type-1 domain-containing protein n=1 Tax=Cuscuta epithymum TaxID=186058 RepID=A0AAV0CX14_9ASTE|nr:unnamed protein product [Cuscuta epithymum]
MGFHNSGGWIGWRNLWDAQVPPKFKYLSWQILDGTLPSVENLRKKGVLIDGGCKLCGLPGEDSDHALRSCSKAEEVWQLVGINTGGPQMELNQWLRQQLEREDAGARCRVLAIIWSLWKRRNHAVWKDEMQEADGVLRRAEGMLGAWQQVRKSQANMQAGRKCNEGERWQRPTGVCLKINVDGAVNDGRGIRSWGWVVRDAERAFIKARGASVSAEWTAEEIEAMGVRDAIIYAKEAGWRNVQVETDALTVVHGISKTEGSTYVNLIFDDIRKLLET